MYIKSKKNTTISNNFCFIQAKLESSGASSGPAAIEQSNEYKMLQTKYTLMVNDNMRCKAALEEARAFLTDARQSHATHAKRMESDELAMQKRLSTELFTLEEALTQMRKEHEMLRIEYEPNVAANEQARPLFKRW